MKNEKATAKPSNNTRRKKPTDKNKKKEPVSIDTTGATGKVRAHAGRGLGNEGTNVSYEEENRND